MILKILKDIADFGNQLYRNIPILAPANFQRWVAIVPARDRALLDDLVNTLRRASQQFRIELAQPLVIALDGQSEQHYERAVEERVPPEAQLVVCIFPTTGRHSGYHRVKQLLCLNRGIPSQCVQSKYVIIVTSNYELFILGHFRRREC